MSDNESVITEFTLATMETADDPQHLPLLSALKENGVNGAPYTPVEREQPMIRFMQQHSNPQLQLQSGLIRYGFRQKSNVLFMLDFVRKILRNKENWARFAKTWNKICKVQAWNVYHLIKFVWLDLMTTERQLPRGLSHDEMSELLDMCQYADIFKQPLKPADRARLETMLKELDLNQRSVKAHENFLHKKAAALRATREKRRRVEMETRRQRCLELEEEARRQRQEWERQLQESQQLEREEEWELTIDRVRRRLQF